MPTNVNKNSQVNRQTQHVTVQLNYPGAQSHTEHRAPRQIHHASQWPSQSSGPVNVSVKERNRDPERIQPNGTLLNYPNQTVVKASDHSALPDYFKQAYSRLRPMMKKSIARGDIDEMMGLADQAGKI